MNWNKWNRQIHRWASMAFMVTVVAYIGVMSAGKTPPDWMTYSPLMPLLVLIVTGVYMFALPYLTKWRSGGRAAA